MNQKKGQNSILLLTTLGVYIGLLMAGGTPGVLAQQAAMTRNFELSEEIETRDELDKDPKQSDAETDSIADLGSLQMVVGSYLARVLNLTAATAGTLSVIPERERSRPAEKSGHAPPSDFSASDVIRSESFTTLRLARAGL